MDPLREHQLRARINAILSQAGHCLMRTALWDPDFIKYGRYSRWSGDHCFETHIDLEELAKRIDVHDGLPLKVYLSKIRGRPKRMLFEN